MYARRGTRDVHSGTASPAADWYIRVMEFTFARAVLGVAWIALVCVVGVLAGAASVLQWIAIASMAVIPPVLARMLSLASVPTPSPQRRDIRR